MHLASRTHFVDLVIHDICSQKIIPYFADLITGVSKSRYFARSIAIKYSNFSRFYKKKGPFYKKIPFLELLETPNIRCPVGGSIGGCGARAVSRKTPIYFIRIWVHFIENSDVISLVIDQSLFITFTFITRWHTGNYSIYFKL